MRRLLVMFFLSLAVNVMLVIACWLWNAHDARVYRTMRIISSETSIAGIVKRLGQPGKIYYAGDECPVPSVKADPRRFSIKNMVYRYDTPEISYYVYIDEDGFVDNILSGRSPMSIHAAEND